MNARVLETIKNSAAVPSMPQVVLRFLEIMQDPNFEYGDLVRVLSGDAGTVSEILRLANSALFGVRNKVVSIKQALTLLGPKRVRSLLLGRYLVDAMASKKVAGLDMCYFWRRSLTSSVVASHFAGSATPKLREEAFVGALLADIGIPILTETFRDKFRPIAERYAPRAEPPTPEEELEAVEVTHAEVSAMVMAHWTLPESVTRAVNLHQSIHPGEGNAAAVARVINGADRIAKLLCEAPDEDHMVDVCQNAAGFVGVGVGLIADMLPTVESEIEELADALRIDVIPSDVYARVAKAVRDRLVAPAAG
jgi:HD-like signal output (HDOD) protein